MNWDELIEHIRDLLLLPQQRISAQPWVYDDEDFIVPIRSAIRHLKGVGAIVMPLTLSKDGILSRELLEDEGLVIAHYVARNMIKGDLTNKLGEGELGLYFRAGPDIIDTRRATDFFEESARSYENEYKKILAVRLSA